MARSNYSQAVEHYETALKYQPEYAQAHANLGGAFLPLGRIQDAITQERAALIIDANLWRARFMLGQALFFSGSKKEAAAEFRAALGQISPDSPQAAGIREWLQKAEEP